MTRCRSLVVALSLLICSTLTVAAQAQPASGGEPIVTTDLLRIRTITEIDIARDGSIAVFAVQSIVESEPADVDDDGEPVPAEYEYRSHLFMIDLLDRSAQAVQLTFGKRNDRNPQISPDGATVAFVRAPTDEDKADADGKKNGPKPQVWLLPLTGGEARPATDFEHGATGPRWSPSGDRLLVTSSIPADDLPGTPAWPLERPARTWNDAEPPAGNPEFTPRPDGTREEIRAWLEQNASRSDPSVITRLEFQDETNLEDPYEFQQLFIINALADLPATDDTARMLTRDFYDHEHPAFMPDGRRIVYAAKKVADQHIDRVEGTDLWLIDTETGEDRLLLAIEGWTFDSPKPSVDGTVIAFRAEELDEPAYRQSRLGLISTRADSGAEPLWLTDTLDASVRSFEWMTTRGSIIFTTAREGAFPMMTISPGLIEPAALVDGPVGVHAFDVGNGAVAYARTDPANPSVLIVSTPRDGDRIAYDPNPWVKDKALSEPVEGWIDRPDGTRIHYWVMEPTNRVEGQTYPLCLNIHGGPSAMWGPGEASMWHEFQLLCSWGYGVVYANPRGSGGYGYDFQKANHRNWGSGPAGDVLAAVDRAIQLPWVDQDRLVVTGGSYAGYLTAWIVAHDHRFKAAVAQRGVYDLATFFGEGNAWRMVERAFEGWPWESDIRQILQRESPFTYVPRVRTPLLIMHASRDLRTGVSQSEMLYRGLKVLNKPVEYVRYPGAGHELSRSGDPHQRMDRLNRIIEFFERHIRNDRPVPLVSKSPAEEVPTEETDDENDQR